MIVALNLDNLEHTKFCQASEKMLNKYLYYLITQIHF